MRLYKTWILNKDDFNESDYLWCKKYANTVKVDYENGSGFYNGQVFYYAKNRMITVETVTQEQEDMLHLKYGNMMLLMAEFRDLGNGWALKTAQEVY